MSSLMRELPEMSCDAERRQAARRRARRRKSLSGASPKRINATATPGQKRMRHRVGHQRQPAQDDERAQHAIGEADERAAEQRALHELMAEWFGEPVHVDACACAMMRVAPEKTGCHKSAQYFPR